ncbi:MULTISPECIES: DUF5305 domain-containing protein [Salinibaculum]
MADWKLRTRHVIDNSISIIVGALVLLALLGGWLTYTTYAAPATTTEQRPGPSSETRAWFNHSATVTENNSVYPVGTTLADRQVYFSSITPSLNGSYSFTYQASESGQLNATVALDLVYRGVEDGEVGDRVVWETTRTLRGTVSKSLGPGDTLTVPFSVDVNRTGQRLAAIEEQLGDPPGQSQVRVRARTTLQGTVNAEPVDRTTPHTLPIDLGGSTYRIGQPGPMTDSEETTRTVTVEKEYGPARSVGAPGLLLVSLSGLVGLGFVRYTDRLGLSRAERRRLTYEEDKREYDDWISRVQLPEEALALPRATTTSLAALVDFAIDTDNRVIEDPQEQTYYVVHDGYLYEYRPPTRGPAGEFTLPPSAGSGTRPPRDGDSPSVTAESENGDEPVNSPSETHPED